MLGGDDGWGCGEFDAEFVTDELRVVVAVCLANLHEKVLDFLQFLGGIDDGQLTDLPPLALIEVIRQSVHQYQLRHQDYLIVIFAIALVPG